MDLAERRRLVAFVSNLGGIVPKESNWNRLESVQRESYHSKKLGRDLEKWMKA